MAEKIEVGVVVKGAGKASAQLNTLDKGIKKAGTGMGGLIKATDAFTGGAASGMISAYAGTLKFIKGLKLTKVALISTGIGAIVVLVGSLVAAFVASEGQAKKLKVMMAGLGAIMDKVSQFAVALGAGLVAAFSGKDVTKAYRQELDKMPGSMQDAVDKAMELELATIRLTAAQKAFSVGAANNSLMAKKYNAMAEDNNRSIDKRIELTKTANEFELESLAIRKDLLEQELAIAEGLREQGDRSSETFDRITAARVALTNLEGEAFDTKRTQSAKINKIREEEAKKAEEVAQRQKEAAEKVAEAERAKAKAIKDAEEARVKSMMQTHEEGLLYVLENEARELEALDQHFSKLEEAQLDYIDHVEDNEFAFQEGELQRQNNHLTLLGEAYEEKRLAIIDKFADAATAAQKAIDDKTAADQKAVDDKKIAQELATAQAVKAARMSVVSSSFDVLNAMAKTEEQTKKLAIAQILVNQGVAMSQAIAGATTSATATGPGAFVATPLFITQALAIVLGSFASIKGVMNQAGAATSGVGASGGGANGAGIASNREGPTLGLTPDISDAVTPGSIPPINAYVVQTQLADQNALAAQIQSATRL
jgi:hypothetical protein|tara:strand:- start:150 stop:1937 length:1788 start_codon:yes stop_codon:yes gene_type:complete